MKRHVYEKRRYPEIDRFLYDEEAEPECGKDFCECGDCLACQHQDGVCWDGSQPSWIIYRGAGTGPAMEPQGTQCGEKAKG